MHIDSPLGILSWPLQLPDGADHRIKWPARFALQDIGQRNGRTIFPDVAQFDQRSGWFHFNLILNINLNQFSELGRDKRRNHPYNDVGRRSVFGQASG